MCENENVLVSACLILLLTASFCIYRVCPEKKLGHHINIEGQGPYENEYKKYCLNGGDCDFLIDEDIVDCNCTRLFGGKRSEGYMWWT